MVFCLNLFLGHFKNDNTSEHIKNCLTAMNGYNPSIKVIEKNTDNCPKNSE